MYQVASHSKSHGTQRANKAPKASHYWKLSVRGWVQKHFQDIRFTMEHSEDIHKDSHQQVEKI